MDKQRELVIKDIETEGSSVIYVMSRDQRIHDNHALLAAQKEALDKELPLFVLFNLLDSTGHRTKAQYTFMVEGLKSIAERLPKLQVGFVLSIGDPVVEISKAATKLDPASVYFDFNPLRGPRAMQKKVAEELGVRCVVVDAHNIIPLWVLSDKEEFAAHTIRNKVHKNLEKWLIEPATVQEHPHPPKVADAPNWDEVERVVSKQTDTNQTIAFASGEEAAHLELKNFIEDRLDDYAEKRNVPTLDQQSNLSPYLHFGQISAQRVALEVLNSTKHIPLLFREGKLAKYEGEATRDDSIDAFLEELIVRKELADNYCFYNADYDSLDGAKDWGRQTLDDHSSDEREHIYSKDEWEAAKTHDEPWNAAQQEMMQTGKMHGYMRMYWAKKILEWSASPQEALDTAIYLNDRYSIDGGDPNGYTGIMWSIAGIHDRPWFEREVYGKIRYMNQTGLKKRFDVDEYVRRWT